MSLFGLHFWVYFYDQHAVMLFLEVNCSNYSDDNSVFEIF